MRRSFWCAGVLTSLFLAGALPISSRAEEKDWILLLEDKGLDAFKNPGKDWIHAGDAGLDPKNPRKLAAKAGTGVHVNGVQGRTRDLVTRQAFGDLEVHVEFLIPKGSNSGVKLQGLYEIQIVDSHGVKNPKGSDCGGVYPRAELKPKYHYLDQGVPPKVNAAKPAGQWQTLHIVFKAPRFDEQGKKRENARFVKVVMNDQVIHEDVELKWPTGHNWTKKEVAQGPLLLQADHGPVAFRKVRVRPLAEKTEK